MPVVEKVAGPRVYVRRVGREFSAGDRADVSDAEAQYLVEERGDFEVVDDRDDEMPNDEPKPAYYIDQGVCPWCEEYEGDGVAQHASSAHPGEWAEYKEA